MFLIFRKIDLLTKLPGPKFKYMGKTLLSLAGKIDQVCPIKSICYLTNPSQAPKMYQLQASVNTSFSEKFSAVSSHFATVSAQFCPNFTKFSLVRNILPIFILRLAFLTENKRNIKQKTLVKVLMLLPSPIKENNAQVDKVVRMSPEILQFEKVMAKTLQ